MEEIEGLTESAEENIHHGAHSGPSWASWVALSTAILAAFAAVAALLSGWNANEAMLHQLGASDHWSYYQAKGIKAAIVETRSDIFVAAGKPADPALAEKLEKYKHEQEEISNEAKALEHERTVEMKRHETFSKAVTFFQVAIAISAISILAKRRRYWLISLAFGVIGLGFLAFGLIQQYFGHSA